MSIFRTSSRLFQSSTVMYGVLLCTACLASMVAAFLVVLFLLHLSADGRQPDPTLLSEAEALRGFSNELLALTHEYVKCSDTMSYEALPSFRAWVDESFQPRVNALRRRLLASDISNGAIAGLLAAADRLSTLAGRPDLREAVVRDVREAAMSAEKRIAALRMDEFIARPAQAIPRLP